MTITDLIASLAPADRTIVIVVALVFVFLFAKALLHFAAIALRGHEPVADDDLDEQTETLVDALREATSDLLDALRSIESDTTRTADSVERLVEIEDDALEDEREATRFAQIAAYTRVGELLEGFDQPTGDDDPVIDLRKPE